MKVDQLKGKIPGVCDDRRLMRRRQGGVSGETEESLSVLLSFDVESLPDKVILGYFSYPLQAFVPKPLCCYRCQAYGHVATVCRREVPRCEKCAEGDVSGHNLQTCLRAAVRFVADLTLLPDYFTVFTFLLPYIFSFSLTQLFSFNFFTPEVLSGHGSSGLQTAEAK